MSGVVRGALIGESLRTGASLDQVPLTVTRITRLDAGMGDQPPIWTIVEFEAPDDRADALAAALADALAVEHGWYSDFHSSTEVTVVFAGRVFRYQRGDRVRRAEVEAYGRSVGVPAVQLDWAE